MLILYEISLLESVVTDSWPPSSKMVFEYTEWSNDELKAWIVSQPQRKMFCFMKSVDIAAFSLLRIRLNINDIESRRHICIPIRGFPKDLQWPLHVPATDVSK